MNEWNREISSLLDEDLVQILGYLNFSSGPIDRKTLSALNRVYAAALPGGPYEGLPAWVQIQQWLQDTLVRIEATNPAFANSEQATSLIEVVWLHFLPAYLDFHRDLLFHQEPEGIINGFFLGKAAEAVLMQGGPWDDIDRIVVAAIHQLNDFVGYRPVAVLEGRRLEPYDHEWVRPVPLYIAGVGTTTGFYHEVIEKCLQILSDTDADLLRRASFDLNLLEELSVDPRAYDFDHPVNQRPNYHFGQWDPHRIDNAGYYRRFVIQQVTLDALLARVEEANEIPRDEALTEASAVLAGTILMASGISGSGPGAFSSTVSLASLLAPIAEYRDEFYRQLLERLSPKHRTRLLEEQKIRRQPLGGARQHLNTYLGRHRASQLEHVQLARLFARMGNAAAAKEQSDFVPVPSARIVSRIDCLMTAADHHLQNGRLEEAIEICIQIIDLVHRGIECGAIVDPWNILGFGGHFIRFEGSDSAVRDHRVEDLVQLIECVFALQSRVWREAAALGREDVCGRCEKQMRDSTAWWRQFAAYEVSDVNATDPQDSLKSAILVAKALQLWSAGGASAGNVRFWAPHAELFDSPKAYALVVESLLERDDFVASMALLVHWLGQADRVGLQKGDDSFSTLARQWMQKLEHVLQTQPDRKDLSWNVAQKFFDYLEANAEHYWSSPVFALAIPKSQTGGRFEDSLGDDFDDRDDGSGDVFGAAYEGVIYNDSTDDGVDSDVPEEGGQSATAQELVDESNRLNQHLTFLNALAQMWKGAALSQHLRQELGADSPVRSSRLQALETWASQAAANRRGLLALMQDVANYKISQGGTDHESMARYDRQRLVKESLLERIISTAVETADARRLLLACLSACNEPTIGSADERAASTELASELLALPDDDRIAIEILGALLFGQHDKIEQRFGHLIEALRHKKLLYIPLSRAGDPAQIYSVRLRRRVLSHLLAWLPRQGFFIEASRLIEAARFIEHNNPVGPGAVTEFDDLFKICFVSMVRSATQNAVRQRELELAMRGGLKRKPLDAAALEAVRGINLDDHNGEALHELEPNSDELINVLEQLTEVMLGSWLSHSRTLRLSVLESVDTEKSWERLVDFIKAFGGPIFTQSFLRLGNVRAILHQGVGHWLDKVAKDHDNEAYERLLEAIDTQEISRPHAERMLGIVLEAIIDHYSEYRDYNSTTTQSDRGDMLYMLLDFLRLRVRYDRVSWNLKPIYWTHEVLVRGGCHVTALQWRRALSERISRESELYIEQLIALQTKYAMRIPTVADRLHERFTRPMTVDRMRALVGPAIRHFRETGQISDHFDLLIDECKLMMEQPTGVGLDIPQWLAALEDEVETNLERHSGFYEKPQYDLAVPVRYLSSEHIASQLTEAAKRQRTPNLPDKSS